MKQHCRILAMVCCLLAFSVHAAEDRPVDGPLHKAVRKGDITAVKALLSGGFDADLKDDSGFTPREKLNQIEGKIKGSPGNSFLQTRLNALAKSIETKIADVNGINQKAYTALHVAAFFGYTDIAALLLDHGARVNAGGFAGGRISGFSGDDQKTVTPLAQAVSQGEIETSKLLLDRGAYVDGVQYQQVTPLYMAISQNRIEAVKLLLDRGANVNLGDTYWGQAPLQMAVKSGNTEIVALVLAKGANLDVTRSGGGTPLQDAIASGKLDVAELIENHILKQAKSPRELLEQLAKKLKDKPDYSTRRLVVKLVNALKPAPAIPEEARKHFVEGTAIVKAAKNPAQQVLAAESFTEALKIAPWWSDAYYNLGVAQELAEQYSEAEKAFTLYLLGNPSENEKREVQDRIYGLSAKRKLSGAK